MFPDGFFSPLSVELNFVPFIRPSPAGLRKGRFWITPDPYHNDDNIQIGREVKISCQVEATPPEELQFGWLKNGRPLRSSERMVITHTDTDVSPGTTNLDIIDLKFTDFGTYTCVASLRNGGSPEISIDVNISSTTGESRWGRGFDTELCHLFAYFKSLIFLLPACKRWIKPAVSTKSGDS